jgi:hypothetical protein
VRLSVRLKFFSLWNIFKKLQGQIILALQREMCSVITFALICRVCYRWNKPMSWALKIIKDAGGKFLITSLWEMSHVSVCEYTDLQMYIICNYNYKCICKFISVGARFSAPAQTGPGAYPASYTMDTNSFPGVKRPGHGVDHPPPSSAEVKDRIELYIYSISGPSWPVIG